MVKIKYWPNKIGGRSGNLLKNLCSAVDVVPITTEIMTYKDLYIIPKEINQVLGCNLLLKNTKKLHTIQGSQKFQ